MRACIAFIALIVVTASAAAQTRDQHLTGNLTSRAPRASFQLQLEAGQIVTLRTESSENLDTVLTLNGPNGQRIAENDDEQPGILSSRIVQVVRTTGRYTAIVSGYNNARGAFDLNVTYGVDAGLSDAARVIREETVSLTAQRREVRYPVDLNAGDIFVATTFALTEGLDTTLALQGANGALIAQSDDRGDGTLNSQIIYQARTAGHYELVASTFGGAGVGDTAISLALDPNAHVPFDFNSIEGTRIAEYQGELGEATSTREYPINLRSGQTVLITAEATTGNLDPVLTLNDADGYPVAINDDRGDGTLNSAFAYTVPETGRYTIELSRYAQSANSGSYRLVVTTVDAAVVGQLQAMADNQVTLSGPELTIETPNFRLHYTLEGRDASTEQYARLTANALEEVLATQVNQLGWAAPVREPDGRYRAYVGEANGNMGYTKPVEMVFDNRGTPNVRERSAARAVLVIDNDFRGMGKKAPPESLMRATATHELNHVIQFGYDSIEGLNWLYEATASWTETVTVGADQDATDYVETDFAAPEVCWTTRTEGFNYAQWTLLQSLADQYGNGIVVKIWESSVTYDGFETMSRTLDGVGTNIPDAVRRWRAQNFARAYELAPRFTRSVALAGSISRDGAFTPRGRIEQLGANYVRVTVRGPRLYSLRGANNAELVGLGERNGRIEVVPLGRGGVFDASSYEYAALMVFNRAIPSVPGECSGVDYSINVGAASGAPAASQYTFDASHFVAPSVR